MAILTNGGGPGAIAADALEANGLELAALSERVRRELEQMLPPAASVRNPVDALASAGPAEFAACLRVLLGDEGVDGVMVILPPPPMTTAAEVARAVIPYIRSAVKPVVMVLMGEDLIVQAARLLRQAHVPDYRFPERAASAMRVLVERARQLERPSDVPRRPRGIRREAAGEILLSAPPGSDRFLDAGASAEIVAAYGVRTPASVLARNAGEAIEAAHRLGFPVVLKVASPDIPHKSDFGGVALGLRDDEALGRAFGRVTSDPLAASPKARIRGVWVQEDLAPGQEVIVGVVRDPQFGPLVMFGSGGVEVEELKDVAFALAPLTTVEAEHLLEETWVGRRLRGYRNLAPADRTAAVDVIVQLGQLAVDFPQITEVEMNPLRGHSQGKGAVALDARVRVEVG
jgi:acetyltransferase